jgi:hypothetical protein
VLDHSCQLERHPHRDETLAVAVEALLRVEDVPEVIVRVLRNAGRKVVATDIADYGFADSKAGVDFLLEQAAPAGT